MRLSMFKRQAAVNRRPLHALVAFIAGKSRDRVGGPLQKCVACIHHPVYLVINYPVIAITYMAKARGTGLLRSRLLLVGAAFRRP